MMLILLFLNTCGVVKKTERKILKEARNLKNKKVILLVACH
jgi:tRNA A37 methylthiotransferase MiaB